MMRTLLDDGAITYDGEFFSYSGLFTFARPVQDHLPVKMGAMRGPKSFQVSAEFSDGCHHALSYTREAYEYMVENCAIGAERAGKNVQDLDLGAWVVFAVGEDSAKAKDAARSMVGLYASSMPHEQLRAQRRRPRRGGADHRRDRRRRHGQGHRTDLPGAGRAAVDRRHAGGVRREDADRDRRRRRSTT